MRDRKILKYGPILTLIFVFGFGLKPICAQDIPESEEVHLRLAVPFRNFDDLTRKDALLAMDMWTKEIVQSVKETHGFHFMVTSEFLENEYENVNFSGHEKYDILLLSALDFIEFKFEDYWDGIALTSSMNHFPEEYIILSRTENAYKNITALKGKQVVFSKNQGARIVLFWLNYILGSQNLGTVNQFFNPHEPVTKDSKAILSVFFKKADACVVGYNQYQTMIELNPQIGRDLEIIEESPPFARGMVSLKKTMDKQIKEIVTGAVLNLPNSQRGKQILKYFGQTNLIPYKSEYLDTYRDMVKSSQTIVDLSK